MTRSESRIWALLIGIDCYMRNRLPDGSWYPSLGGCVRDAERRVTSMLPDKLIESIAREGCTFVIGPDADTDYPISHFAERLAIECNYPPGYADRSLPSIARYYQTWFCQQHNHAQEEPGYVQLINRMLQWHNQAPTRARRLATALTAMPVNRIVDCTYTGVIGQALIEAGHTINVLLDDSDVGRGGSEIVLAQPLGSVDHPDFLAVTIDRILHLSVAQPHLFDLLRSWFVEQTVVWIGMDPRWPCWRSLYDILTEGSSSRNRRAYALAVGEVAEAWTKLAVTVIPTEQPVSWLASLTQTLANRPKSPTTRSSTAPPVFQQRPYKFLDFYTENEIDLFFGREQCSDEIVNQVLTRSINILFGQSGIGKTSLLRAGLLPRLEQRACCPLYLRPAADPIATIRTAIIEQYQIPHQELALIRNSCAALLKKLELHTQKTPVILLDQAEECFTLLSAKDRERWTFALAESISSSDASTRWLLSLREDYLPNLHSWSHILPEILDRPILLSALSRTDARNAIVRPAHMVGVGIEAELVERILDDLEEDNRLLSSRWSPIQLQIICDRLYQMRSDDKGMTLVSYEHLGGLQKIMADYLEVALSGLAHEDQPLAMDVLRLLVSEQETNAPLRADAIVGSALYTAEQRQAMLETLVSAQFRLVRVLKQDADRTYELMHDVLAPEIMSWFNKSEPTEQEISARQAKAMIQHERSFSQRLQVPPDYRRLEYILRQHDNAHLHLDPEEIAWIFRSAIAEGGPGIPAWANRVVAAGIDIWPIIAEGIHSPVREQRSNAYWALAGVPDIRSIDLLRAALSDPSPMPRNAVHRGLTFLAYYTEVLRFSGEQLSDVNAQARELLLTSSDLRMVPEGAFIIGSGSETIQLPFYYIEKYPVTVESYARFIADNGYDQKQCWTKQGWIWRQRSDRRTAPYRWQDQQAHPDHPVTGVTWYEAQAYARWANRRLPSEAEWEKAARGVSGNIYPWGNEFDPERCNSIESALKQTTPVGHFSPAGDSPYGVADMAGNVSEWTASLLAPYPYRADDGREDPEKEGDRVLRGGSFNSYKSGVRCAQRDSRDPTLSARGLGFRCVYHF